MSKAVKRTAAVLMAILLLFSDSAFMGVNAQEPEGSGMSVEAESIQSENETVQNPEQEAAEAASEPEEGTQEDKTAQQPVTEDEVPEQQPDSEQAAQQPEEEAAQPEKAAEQQPADEKEADNGETAVRDDEERNEATMDEPESLTEGIQLFSAEEEILYNSEGIGEIDSSSKLLKAGSTKGKYILTEDISLTEDSFKVTEQVELDLGGHSLNISLDNANTDGVAVYNGGSLTIGGSGAVTTGQKYLFNIYDGEMVINGGSYEVPRYLFYTIGDGPENKAILTINAGEFSNTEDSYAAYFSSYSECYIYGGSFAVQSGIALMNSIKATVGVSSDLKNTTMGNYIDQKYKLTEEEYDIPVKLVWGREGSAEGPEIVAKDAAIYGNFWKSETDITVNSGKIISEDDTAIYQPQQGKFVMNGGLIQGDTAIDAKMGSFIFHGGYVIGTGEAHDASGEAESQLGGTTANGSAINLQTGYYGSLDVDGKIGYRGSANQQDSPGKGTHLPRNNDLSLTITGGVFISKNNAAICAQDWNMCEQKISYSITGGRFSSFPKTVHKVHGEGDRITEYGLSVNDTVQGIDNYLISDNCKFAPAAHYDGVGLSYGYTGADAPFYASLADAVADRNNDPDARAYIYYLLDNGLPQTGSIDRQLQIFYNLDKEGESIAYIPENLKNGIGNQEGAVFGYSFEPSGIQYNEKQYVLSDMPGVRALWSPAVTYDANGGSWGKGQEKITEKTVLATAAKGAFEGDGYGYVVNSASAYNHITLDENGKKLEIPEGILAAIPNKPVNGKATFLGWFLDKEGNVPFDAASTQIKANMTVYAKWEAPEPVDWNTSKSKTATNLDGNFESQVTLSLPSAEVQPSVDVALVIDVSSSMKDKDIEEAKKAAAALCDELAAKKNVDTHIGIVIFDKTAHDLTNGLATIDEAKAAIETIKASYDTNMMAGLIAGKEMLDQGTSEEKYLILMSDGIPIYWVNEAGEPTSKILERYARDGKTMISSMAAGTEPEASDNDLSAMLHIEELLSASDWSSDSDTWKQISDTGETLRDNGYKYTNIQKSTYMTAKYLQENILGQYNLKMIAFGTDKYENNVVYKYGENFCDWIGNQAGVSYFKVAKPGYGGEDGELVTAFEAIADEVIYLLDAGSHIDDYIGYVKDDYDFDFVNQIDKLTLTVGGKKLPKTQIDANTYGFGAGDGSKDGSTYPYTVTYLKGNGKEEEHFVWNINVPVTIDQSVQLTYTVRLKNPKTTAGSYGVYDRDGSQKKAALYTNNSAVLYPVDSEGNSGLPEEFAKPTVSYTVPETPVKPGEPDKPVTPANPTAPANSDKPSGSGHTSGGSSKSSEPSKTANVRTGDESNLMLWMVLLVLAGGSVTAVCVTYRKRTAGRHSRH